MPQLSVRVAARATTIPLPGDRDIRTRRRLFETLTVAQLAVLIIGNGLALAALPEGKGGGSGSYTTLPNVRYTISEILLLEGFHER